MKTKSMILASVAMTTLPFGLLAEPPPKAPAAPVPPVTVPDRADPQALASAAVQKEIVQVLQAQNEQLVSSYHPYGRARPPTAFSYSFVLTNMAPDNVSPSPEKVPFEVHRVPVRGLRDAAPVAYLSGYYHTTDKSLRLYDPNAKAYVAAADHLLMNNRGR